MGIIWAVGQANSGTKVRAGKALPLPRPLSRLAEKDNSCEVLYEAY